MTWPEYSKRIEPCGEPYGFGDTCPLAREKQWVSRLNRENTTEGEATSALTSLRALEHKYDRVYSCLSGCEGLCAYKAYMKQKASQHA